VVVLEAKLKHGLRAESVERVATLLLAAQIDDGKLRRVRVVQSMHCELRQLSDESTRISKKLLFRGVVSSEIGTRP
jgi:hypothetical protein